MTDIEKAKSLLINDKTLVFVKGDDVVYSSLSGIKPLITFLNEGINLEGYSLADKIIGKAQAMLCVKAKIREVYGKVISKGGQKILEKYGIPYTYDTLTDEIINRKGTDVCPMEKIVTNIENIEEAYLVLKEKIREMNL